jgi:Fe2+ or Zn2+ uptake regulation protein
MPRPSHVRSAVHQLIATSQRHDWSVDTTAAALDVAGVPASFSAVWRALEHLESSGAVRRVELGDAKTRYEAAGAHHDHVQCERCGAVQGLDSCLLHDAATAAEEQSGFRIRAHDLVLRGLCPTCHAIEDMQ